MKYIIFIISFALLFSCKQNEITAENTDVEKESIENIVTESVFITMERTACFGKCPIYKIKIYNTGKVEYKGIKFTDKEGYYTKNLTQTQLSEIKDLIGFIKFFKMEDKYDSNISDLPSVVLFVSYKDQKKKVLDRHGAPNELKQLETLIDYLVIDNKLKKIETE